MAHWQWPFLLFHQLFLKNLHGDARNFYGNQIYRSILHRVFPSQSMKIWTIVDQILLL